jgi:hypothetical protein
VRQTENGNYITLSGQDFAANQSVTLRFTGLSAISQSSRVSPGVLAAAPGPAANRAILLIVIGLVGTGIGLLAAWPLLRGRTLREGGSPAAIQGDRAALVDALARLDLAHEAGEVSDASYQDQRLRLKARLLDLMPEESSP